MRISTVLKIIAGLFILMLMVFFVFENLDPVTIWIPLIKERSFGLIYILAVFYILGVSNAFWVITFIGARRKRNMKLHAVADRDQSLFEGEE